LLEEINTTKDDMGGAHKINEGNKKIHINVRLISFGALPTT
jgi:hypothetical protein